MKMISTSKDMHPMVRDQMARKQRIAMRRLDPFADEIDGLDGKALLPVTVPTVLDEGDEFTRWKADEVARWKAEYEEACDLVADWLVDSVTESVDHDLLNDWWANMADEDEEEWLALADDSDEETIAGAPVMGTALDFEGWRGFHVVAA